MKSIFTLTFSLCCALSVWAQGNLQFSQVRQIKRTSTSSYATINGTYNSYIHDTSTFVVPTGKILKIESAACIELRDSDFDADPSNGIMFANAPVGLATDVRAFVDDYLVFIFGSVGYTTFPIWLPEGAHTLTVTSMLSSAQSTPPQPKIFVTTISALEFNIVP